MFQPDHRPNILIEQETHRVLCVCSGQPQFMRDAHPTALWVTTRPHADLFYQAIAGHRWKSHPDTADPIIARSARAWLEAQRDPVAHLLTEAVRRWGPFIRPWFSVTRLEQGRIVLDDPAYQKVVRL